MSRLWRLVVLFVTSVVVSLSAPALAAKKDKNAEAKYEEAMDAYFNVKIDEALKILDGAIKACGKKDCSSDNLGKLYVLKGVVLAGGKNDMAAGKKAFADAFAADPKAEPLTDFFSPDMETAFNEAKEEAAAAGGDDDDDDDDDGDDDDDDDDDRPAPGGDLDWDAPTEAKANTPLPVWVKIDDDMGAAAMTIRYKPFGGTKWLRVKMKKMKGGFGALVPCTDVNTLGTLKMYIIVEDEAGDPISTAGTRSRPLLVKIKNELDGEQPSFPGEEPPEKCMTKADCPPDFPGCKAVDDTSDGGRGDKGWGATCEETEECKEGYACLGGFCEQSEGDDDDDSGSDSGLRHIISLGLQIDALLINSQENVCGSAESATERSTDPVPGFACFIGDEQFQGRPAAGRLNQVQGGLAFASVRPLLGYDLDIWDGLGVGVRVGAAFPGSPSTQEGSFIPFHAELRGFYYILGRDGFVDGLLHPYASLGIGFGHVDASVQSGLCSWTDQSGTNYEAGVNPADNPGNCPSEGNFQSQREEVDVYFRTGDFFVPIAVGNTFMFSDMWGASVELKMMVMFGNGGQRDTGFVLAPNLGPVVMF